MKLSIFSKALPHPITKVEKDFNSKFCSSPHKPEVIEITTDKQLIDTVTGFAWSPGIFKTYRKNNEFVSTDFMVLDIDKGLTISAAEKKCRQMNCTFFILPTTNHTAENHRFRIILPLLFTITSVTQYKQTWQMLREFLPEIDEHCSDVARFYFASKITDSVFFEGNLLRSVEKKVKIKETEVTSWVMTDTKVYKNDVEILRVFSERIPECVDYFYKNAGSGLSGQWICSLNACVFTLAAYGLSEEYIWAKIEELAPEELDDRDKFHIQHAIKEARVKSEIKSKTSEYLNNEDKL